MVSADHMGRRVKGYTGRRMQGHKGRTRTPRAPSTAIVSYKKIAQTRIDLADIFLGNVPQSDDMKNKTLATALEAVDKSHWLHNY